MSRRICSISEGPLSPIPYRERHCRTFCLKKSSKVDLGLVAALALSLASCNSSQMQRCVDDGNVVAPEQFCSPGFTSRYHWGSDASGQQRCLDANNMPVNDLACTTSIGRHYHWYYGGRGSYVSGSTAYAGSESPRSGAHYSTASEAHGGSGDSGHSGVSRSGFGAAGRGGA